MSITVKNLQKKIPISRPRIIRTTQKILDFLNITKADISLVFVSSRKMRAVNARYLNHDFVTDVLTFDLKDDLSAVDLKTSDSDLYVHAEIIIAPDVARRNALLYKTDFRRELLLYIIHGLLHLLGYSDKSPNKERLMRLKEQEVLKAISPADI